MIEIVIKAILLLLFVVIFFCLGQALYYLVTGKGRSDGVVRALTWRLVFSLILFLILLVAFALGWIAPHPI